MGGVVSGVGNFFGEALNPITMGFWPGSGGLLNQQLSGGNTPQRQGYGIATPPPPAAYTSSPGLQAPQVAINPNFDQSTPGAAEDYWTGNQARFQGGATNAAGAYTPPEGQPQQAEQYWNSVAGKAAPQFGEGVFRQTQGALQGPSQSQAFAAPAQQQLRAPSQSQSFGAQAQPTLQGPSAAEQFFRTSGAEVAATPRNAQSVFDQFQRRDPGLDAYYDRAAQKTTQDTNRALAAQGLMGSAFGANTSADALSNLRAEQANREADFSLQEAGLAGQLARGADIGGLEGVQTRGQLANAASNAQLGRLGLGADIAGQTDQAMLQRLGLGSNIAGQVDNTQLARLGLLGNLGGQADQAALAHMMGMGGLSQNAQALGLQRNDMGFQNAMAMDQFGLQQALGGAQVSGQAQNFEAQRAQAYLDNLFRQQQAATQAFAPYYQNAMAMDQQLMDAAMAAEMGLSQQATEQGYRNQERHKEDASWGVGLMGDFLSMGSGMGF